MMGASSNILEPLSNFENATMRPVNWKLWRNFLLSLSLIILIAFSGRDSELNTNNYPYFVVIYTNGHFILMALCLFIKYLHDLISQSPNISISNDIFTIGSFFRKKSWRWKDIGPFCIDWKQKFFGYDLFICAFDKETSDIFAVNGITLTPTRANADVCFPLSVFSENDAEYADKLLFVKKLKLVIYIISHTAFVFWIPVPILLTFFFKY